MPLNGARRDQRSGPGSQWGTTGRTVTRRVVAGFDATADTTGLYPYQFEVGKVTSGNNYSAIRTESGTLPIVNRINSPFGALDRAVRLSEDRALCADVVREAIALGFPRDVALEGGGNGEEAGDAAVRRRLLEACQRYGWDAGRAAAALAISRATLYRRLK